MDTRGTFSCLEYVAFQTMGNVKITEFTASEICSPLHHNVIHERSFIMDSYIFCKPYNMPNMPAMLAFQRMGTQQHFLFGNWNDCVS